MSASDLYRQCFWCGHAYDIWRNEACNMCGSRLESDGPGSLASEWNKRPDYSGPDFSERLAQRQTESLEFRKRYPGL